MGKKLKIKLKVLVFNTCVFQYKSILKTIYLAKRRHKFSKKNQTVHGTRVHFYTSTRVPSSPQLQYFSAFFPDFLTVNSYRTYCQTIFSKSENLAD